MRRQSHIEEYESNSTDTLVIGDNDPDRVFGRDGAIEALLTAKKSGQIRFFGFSGAYGISARLIAPLSDHY